MAETRSAQMGYKLLSSTAPDENPLRRLRDA
jgi:hypothetical protein